NLYVPMARQERERFMRRNYLVLGSMWCLLATVTAVAAAPTERDPAWVLKRVQEWQPTVKERRWETIGWAKDIREAIRVGKQRQGPIFLFTHDGRLNVGRC